MSRAGKYSAVILSCFAVSGILSGFFIGFPFGNHNESYAWIPRLARMHLADVFIPHYALSYTYRPLADAVAWVLYHGSNGSIIPQQVFNGLVAVIAWLYLYFSMPLKKISALTIYFLGFYAFAGYIYLFHLHGVFYSPLLLFAVHLCVVSARADRTQRQAWILFCIAFLGMLFHPFAMLLFAAYALGKALSRAEYRPFLPRWIYFVQALLAVVLILLFVSKPAGIDIAAAFKGVMTSYRLLEAFPGFLLIPGALSLLTVTGMPLTREAKRSMIIAVAALIGAYYFLHLPGMLLWILVCLYKSAAAKNHPATLLLLSTALLPAASPTGSPTYALFVLPVCAMITLRNTSLRDDLPIFRTPLAAGVLVIQAAVVALIMLNVKIPLCTRAAAPMLAEKEKTHQMESIVNWFIESGQYECARLLLYRDITYPVVSGYPSAVTDRRLRAPAAQFDIDPYIRYKSGAPLQHADTLLVTFGNERIAGATIVHTIPGEYNGSAFVFKKPR